MNTYAQTIIQLFNQLLREGYSTRELCITRDTYGLAMRVFSGRFQASGKVFIAHGIGVASILASLHQPAEAVAAGLIHNVYRSGDFGDGKMDVTKVRRRFINNAVGKEVEEYAYRFHNFTSVPQTVALKGVEDTFDALSPIERNVVLILLADILEHHLDNGVLYRCNVEQRKQFARDFGNLIIRIAKRFGSSSLSSDFEEVLRETSAADIPSQFQNRNGRSQLYVIPPRNYRQRLPLTISRGMERCSNFVLHRFVSPSRHLVKLILRRMRTVVIDKV